MTENEAIIEIKRWTNILMNAGSQCTLETAKAQEMAIKTLKEIQQYRSIGTVEDLKGMKESYLSGLELAQIAISIRRLKEYEDLGITPDQIKELDRQYTEKCSQIKEIVKRLKKEAEDARAGGNPEISGSYIRAIHIIKEIAEGWPELTDDKLVDLAIKKMEQRKREAK